MFLQEYAYFRIAAIKYVITPQRGQAATKQGFGQFVRVLFTFEVLSDYAFSKRSLEKVAPSGQSAS